MFHAVYRKKTALDVLSLSSLNCWRWGVANRLVFFFVLLATLTGPVAAAKLAGVDVADQVRIAGYDRPLLLNGAGIRKKFFISVYVGALYLPQPQKGVGDLLVTPPANRVAMYFVYSEVAKRRLDGGWREGFENNVDPAQYAELRPRLERFVALFGDMHDGDQVWLDYVPGEGTRVSINGVRQGVIAGADFNAALLAVWLGRYPVSESLKNAMVGVDNSRRPPEVGVPDNTWILWKTPHACLNRPRRGNGKSARPRAAAHAAGRCAGRSERTCGFRDDQAKARSCSNEGDTDHENVYLLKGKVVLLSGRSVVERIKAGTDTARFPLAHQLPRKFSARADSKVRIVRIDSRQLSDMLARTRTVDYQVADFDEAYRRRLDEHVAAVARAAAGAGVEHPARHDERRAGRGRERSGPDPPG